MAVINAVLPAVSRTTGSLLAMPGLVMLTVMVTCLGPVLGPAVAMTGTASPS